MAAKKMNDYKFLKLMSVIHLVFVTTITIMVGSSRIEDEISIFLHQDIINKDDNIYFAIVPRNKALIMNASMGLPHLSGQINMSLPYEWGNGQYIEYGDSIKEVNFSKLVDARNNEIQNITISILSDVFVSMLQVIYSEKAYYYSIPFCQTIWLDKYFDPYFLPNRVIGSYDTVVCIGHYNIRVYGHYIIDFLAPLTLLPKEVLDRCVIPFAKRSKRTARMMPSPFALKGLHLIGIHKKQLIEMMPQDLIFAKNAYYFNYFPFNYDCSEAFRRLHKSILMTHPSNSVPFRFGLYNRKKTQHRHIHNFKEIVHEAKRRWPELNPEVIPDFYVFFKAIKYYQELRIFWMGFHGSVLGNIIFMQSGTVVIEVQTRRPFTNSISITLPLGINHIMSRYPFVGHFEFTKVFFNMTDTMKCIEMGIELTKG